MEQVGKKVLVTGASSALMSDLMNTLIDNGYQIVGVSRDIEKVDKKLAVKWVECDLVNPDQSFTFLKGIDFIIHAAGLSNSYQANDYMLVNYQSTKNLVDASMDYCIKRFIYISSILAGNANGEYGFSKLKAEEYIQKKIDNWLIIRPSQLYGYSSIAPIDQLINTVKKKIFAFCPVGDTKSIMPLYFRDLSNSIYEVAFKNRESNIVKQIVGPESFTYRDLIILFADVFNKKVKIIPIPKFVIMSVYHVVQFLNLKIGIYPDQLFRFYANDLLIECPSTDKTRIIDYIQANFDNL
jgi:nucleoside-diphosphate-sugar epimerase